MSKILPPSLVAYFVPPTDCIGEFALLTGYSASCRFLDDALEKFTHQVSSQRAYDGHISIALMLDPGHEQITTVDCPGLLHLASSSEISRGYKLLHAKVGLLLFKNEKTKSQTIRLIVSSGNWTVQTLEDSLDLVWSIDYQIDTTNSQQTSADIAVAYDFLTHTLQYFDHSLLLSAQINPNTIQTAIRYKVFKETLLQFKVVEGITPRFFDNRKQSLLKQLSDLAKSHAGGMKRNKLLLGSGFYEGESNTGKVPKAISAIESTLRIAELLTNEVDKNIYINPMNCQAIATSIDILNENDWKIRSAFDSLFEDKIHQRSLHAKFIFAANFRAGNNKCLNSWLYLGSGNLTSPGLLNKSGKASGNLEAGVVFSPDRLYWQSNTEPELSISQKLPVDFSDENKVDSRTQLSAGEDMPEPETVFMSPPVSYFTVHSDEHTLKSLMPYPATNQIYQVLGPEGEPCNVENTKIAWPYESPRQVRVAWKCKEADHNCYVPVIDEFGRLAATPLPELELDDAWWQLGAFPSLPLDDASGDSYELEPQHKWQHSSNSGSDNSSYHLNSMMGLIESIAQKQVDIDEADWGQWCRRLEQTMCQMGNSAVIEYFKNIEINPVSPLWAVPFRPTFAEDANSKAGELYENVLRSIENKLELTDLAVLGGRYE